VVDRGSSAGLGVFDDVVARHREAHRRYHNLRHVVWVIRHVRELAGPTGVTDSVPALAAAFFRDAIYDATRADNEARSATLAARQLTALGWEPHDVAIVTDHVLATAGHVAVPLAGLDGVSSDDDPIDRSRAVLLDSDLAVLGADPAGYQAYATGVRVEYGHLADDAWSSGRAAVLAALLARPVLYLTASGRDRWEARARANLAAERSTLVRSA
jgi:predicted metal-dependent HD superfamily phosphohydrolase